MTDTTLDAAILFAVNQAREAEGLNSLTDLGDAKHTRTFARALIAKLLEGAELTDTAMYDDWATGYQDALTDIRRRAGIEGEMK
jgi:hypothetical protein